MNKREENVTVLGFECWGLGMLGFISFTPTYERKWHLS